MQTETGVPAQLEALFTPQDEEKELFELTINDMIDVQSDLFGIASGVSGLSVAADGGISTSDSLARLDGEIRRLPSAQTAAYRRATVECPDQVSDERKMAFLDYEQSEPSLAAKRLVDYWNFRLDVFGADRCFLPMTLNGAMKDEVVPMTKQCILQLMPVTDTAGRAILFFSPNRRNFDVYGVEQEFRALLYFFETIMEDAELRKRGVVMLIDGREIHMKHYSRKEQRLSPMMDRVLPLRIRAFHDCNPSKVLFYVLYPIVKRFIGKNTRLRIKMHFGTEANVLAELEAYCLPKDRVPTELGGDVILDINQWVLERIALENARSSADGPDGPDPKKLRSEDTSASGVALAADLAPEERELGHKGRRKGRHSDPRMKKAVEAKQAVGGRISLYEALVAGGFTFTNDSRRENMIDADGITLTQKKNQLCRRLRQEKARQKARQVFDSSNDTATSSEGNGASSSSPMSASPVSLPTGTASRSFAGEIEKCESGYNADNGRERLDSFDEAIMEIPGIEDLSDIAETNMREKGDDNG